MVYYIGVMSGTSLDGIDVVLVNFDEEDEKKFIVEKSYTQEIPEDVKQDILSICQGQQTTLSKVGDLDRRLGILYAKAINEMMVESGIDSSLINAIGCHGQTVHHEPSQSNDDKGFTIQLGDCNRIVALTNITTIGDFRRRDMAYGGQGAPLVPAFHKSCLSSNIENRVILNIGGISNITILIPNVPVKGFDTGPGNILLDSWISLKKQNQVSYDKDGEWAKQGTVNEALLTQLLNSTDYFNKPSPKSTGRELFNISWLLNILSSYDSLLSDIDVQATLLEFTCVTIVDEIIKIGIKIDKVLVCGGGFKNTYLMQRLTSLLHSKCNGCLLSPVDDYGINSQDMEAVAFAYFAKNTINNKPSNLIEVTNASRETILGSIYLKNK